MWRHVLYDQFVFYRVQVYLCVIKLLAFIATLKDEEYYYYSKSKRGISNSLFKKESVVRWPPLILYRIIATYT